MSLEYSFLQAQRRRGLALKIYEVFRLVLECLRVFTTAKNRRPLLVTAARGLTIDHPTKFGRLIRADEPGHLSS